MNALTRSNAVLLCSVLGIGLTACVGTIGGAPDQPSAAPQCTGSACDAGPHADAQDAGSTVGATNWLVRGIPGLTGRDRPARTDGGVADAANVVPGTDAGTAHPGTDAGSVLPVADAGTVVPVADAAVAPDVTVPHGALGLVARDVTASGATLSWTAVPGATAARVYLAAEPGATPDDALPDAVLLATLTAGETTYAVAQLAPSVDAFLRVEVSAPVGGGAANVHVHTVGGPRAALDGPVREVHGYAPRVLEVVVTNGTGAAWESGPWTVTRRDGSPLAVTRVNRHSIPIGAPSYALGWGAEATADVVDADHRIFLTLAAPVGSRDVLRVTGPAGVAFTLPFSDRYLETPVLQVNQVGYNPRAAHRWAYVSGHTGDGGPLALADFPATAEVLVEPADDTAPRAVTTASLALTVRAANDADSGGEVREIDLASVPAAEGARYRVRVPGVGVSWPTAVSERGVFRGYYTLTRGLYLNRWAGDLRPAFTDWARPADHTSVFTSDDTGIDDNTPMGTPQTGARTLLGGYHDAGDFDQRPMHTVVPQLLLRAFETQTSAFSDGQLTLPESGNGIPDLLDEALWGVASWEQLQETDGGVRAGAQSYREPWGFYHANADPLPFWTMARDPNVTARAAGVFAQAARLVAPYDAAHAATLRTRAVNAWNYAVTHGAATPYRLYPAGELFRLTGDATYRSAFETAWGSMGPSGAFSNFAENQFYMGDYLSNNRAMADYILAYIRAPGADPAIVTMARTYLAASANNAVERTANAHAHRNARPTGMTMDWGYGTAVARFLDSVIAMRQLGGLAPDVAQRYFDAQSIAMDYLFGCNPNGLVYVTGLGSRRPMEPLHLDSLAFVKEAMPVMPGIPVYGPSTSLPAVGYYAAAANQFYPAFDALPPGLRYGDVRTLVVNNEFSVWEVHAPEVELAATMLADGQAPPATWLPGGSEHRSTLP